MRMAVWLVVLAGCEASQPDVGPDAGGLPGVQVRWPVGGGDHARWVAVGDDGARYVAGVTDGSFGGQPDQGVSVFVTRIGADDEVAWTRRLDGRDEEPAGIFVDGDQVIVPGRSFDREGEAAPGTFVDRLATSDGASLGRARVVDRPGNAASASMLHDGALWLTGTYLYRETDPEIPPGSERVVVLPWLAEVAADGTVVRSWADDQLSPCPEVETRRGRAIAVRDGRVLLAMDQACTDHWEVSVSVVPFTPQLEPEPGAAILVAHAWSPFPIPAIVVVDGAGYTVEHVSQRFGVHQLGGWSAPLPVTGDQKPLLRLARSTEQVVGYVRDITAAGDDLSTWTYADPIHAFDVSADGQLGALQPLIDEPDHRVELSDVLVTGGTLYAVGTIDDEALLIVRPWP